MRGRRPFLKSRGLDFMWGSDSHVPTLESPSHKTDITLTCGRLTSPDTWQTHITLTHARFTLPSHMTDSYHLSHGKLTSPSHMPDSHHSHTWQTQNDKNINILHTAFLCCKGHTNQ